MKFKGSLIKEQGVAFAIIIVKPFVLNNASDIEKMNQLGRTVFGLVPIILMSQNSNGIPTYYGRKDIVQFLSHVPLYRIPWREYSVA